MASSYFKFRITRANHRLQKWLKTAELWSQNYIRRHIYGAWKKLGVMRGEFAAWMLIIIISITGLLQGFAGLDSMWLTDKATYGGTYREGLVGHVRLVNPLYIDNTATADVADLVFSKLIRQVGPEEFSGDLAEKWDVSTDKRTYTFHLRDGVKWHDGVAFDAADVDFTLHLIQNPDTRSTAAGNWDGVTVNAVNAQTVQFILPASYNGFLSTLARVGIVPEHVLSDRQPKQLRIDQFNQRPIGTGPFILNYLDINSNTIHVERNNDYFGGRAYLDAIQFTQFDDSKSLADAYAKRELDGLSQVDPAEADSLQKSGMLQINRFRLPSYVGAFYNTARPPLADPAVRRSLDQAIDRNMIVKDMLHGEGNVAHYPIPAQYPGFSNQALRISFDAPAAKQALNGKIGDTLRLVTVNTGVYPALAKRLVQQWGEAGVKVEVLAVDSYSLQQNYIRPREYDILLYGQDLGGDSDMFSFWHSSQAADPGLNLSAYKNATSDQLIEQARFGKDPAFRDAKYRDFLATWAQDAPALLIYSPYYLYAHTTALTGMSAEHLIGSTGRFLDVNKWAIKSERVPKSEK
jgi:peptide/nickel transport system substrate-binding protein